MKNITIFVIYLLMLSSCSINQYEREETNIDIITIGHSWLSPSEVIISEGMVVKWINTVDMKTGGHTLVFKDTNINSGLLKNGESFVYKFEKPGTYEYYIEEHPKASGKIIVESSGAFVVY